MHKGETHRFQFFGLKLAVFHRYSTGAAVGLGFSPTNKQSRKQY